MSYTIQIEPPKSTKMNNKVESKRQSFYTCIRYASKLIKLRTEIRRHKTLPNDFIMIPTSTPTKITNTTKNYCHTIDDNDEEEAATLYDEKDVLTNNKYYYKSRCESQPALPSRLQYIVTKEETTSFDEEDDEENDDEDEEEQDKLNDYIINDTTAIYNYTLEKLSGISFKSNKKNTAVLITLSPCTLAAANAARQKRQKIRISH